MRESIRISFLVDDYAGFVIFTPWFLEVSMSLEFISCSQCGHQNPSTSKICVECGALLIPPGSAAETIRASSSQATIKPDSLQLPQGTHQAAQTPQHQAQTIPSSRFPSHFQQSEELPLQPETAGPDPATGGKRSSWLPFGILILVLVCLCMGIAAVAWLFGDEILAILGSIIDWFLLIWVSLINIFPDAQSIWSWWNFSLLLNTNLKKPCFFQHR